MMQGNKYYLTIFTIIQKLNFYTSQTLTFDRDVAIEPIGNGLFLVDYGGVLDYYDKNDYSFNHKNTVLRSVSLHDSQNKTLGRILR